MAIDLGFSPDPTVVICGAYDSETDTYYLYAGKSFLESPISEVASYIKANQLGYIKLLMPHDSAKRESSSGASVKQLYNAEGVLVHNNIAGNYFADSMGKCKSKNAGVMFMEQLMLTGRLKIHVSLEGWFREFRTYAWKDGKLVDKDDHWVKC